MPWAPLKMKMVTQHPPKAWFNDGITKQKQVVRNREHMFKKYKSKSTWMALKAERHKLHNTIYLAKKDHISDLVAGCGNDSGKLYKLANNLTGCKSECPLPDKDPESLAEEFADFFLDKINTICQDLAQYTPTPVRLDVSLLSNSLNQWQKISIQYYTQHVLKIMWMWCCSNHSP